ncbi:golgin subfamily A member 6-like protein 26 isoform X2 [Erythrolamprus reginae]|uniref:golgin subfamily A member 6-like protein 26 isoform X2 n=1 Tax=Erythrolamprus reginae TaxID=121349 RepID=UPI00396C73AE
MAIPCPTFRTLQPALDSSQLVSTSKQVPAEASKEKSAPLPGQRPHQSLTQHGVENMASLGEKASALWQECSAKSSSGTDRGRRGQLRKRIHHARIWSSGTEGDFSRKSGFLELERGEKGSERSSEARRNIPRSSRQQMVIGDPWMSWQKGRRTTSKIRIPPRRAEDSHPEKTSPGHRGGGGEPLAEDQRILPHSVYPPKAKLLGGKETVAPFELGTDPGIIYGPRDAQKPPGLARRLGESLAVALCTKVHSEVPERRENARAWTLSSSPLHSSVSDADEEGFEQLTGQSRRTSGHFRRWAPNWKEITAGNHKLNQHVALELENSQQALRERRELARRLELQMEKHQDQVEEARAELVLLGYKREICLKEVVELEEELSLLRRQGRQYRALQVEVSHLAGEREELKDQVHCLEDQLSSLELQLKNSRAQWSSMEEMASEKQLQEALLSEKDLEIAKLHERISGLEVEKEALGGIVRSLEEGSQQRLEQLQEEASREKEKELCKLREEVELQERLALQKCAESSEAAKASALREQAVTFQKEIEELQKSLNNTLLQERKKWEANAQAALRMQQEALAEQDRRRRADLQRALEKERKLNHTWRNEAADLHQKIEGLENQVRLEEEKRGSLEELQVGLQKEKDEALEKLREELEQERMQEREGMRTKLQQMEESKEHLQTECSRLSLREHELQAEVDRMDHFWATQVALACQQLQELLPEKSTLLPHLLCRGAIPLSCGAAFQALREVKEVIQSYIQDLNHELERQRQRVVQIQREKEVELRQQKEQLHLENRSILEALKEQMVQEHLSDILALQRSWLKEGQEKDKPTLGPPPEERVGEWPAPRKDVAGEKDKTDRTPIDHPKRELDLETEGRLSSNPCKNLAIPGSGGRTFSTGWSRWHPSATLYSPSLGARPSRPPNPNVLHHLQDRIRKLRAENDGYLRRGSLGPSGSFHEGLDPPQEERGGLVHPVNDLPTLKAANSLLWKTK